LLEKGTALSTAALLCNHFMEARQLKSSDQKLLQPTQLFSNSNRGFGRTAMNHPESNSMKSSD